MTFYSAIHERICAMSYHQYKTQFNYLLIVIFLLSNVIKEIENSYKLKLVDEKELNEHFSLFYLIIPLLYLSPIHLIHALYLAISLLHFHYSKRGSGNSYTTNNFLRLVNKLFLSSSNLKLLY